MSNELQGQRIAFLVANSGVEQVELTTPWQAGATNPDKLRLVAEAVSFVKSFAEAGKPIAAICHGPGTLVEAEIVKGKTLTSWPSLQTDIRNAGGQWRDEEVFTCPPEGFTLLTSRKPDDFVAFTDAPVEAFSKAG